MSKYYKNRITGMGAWIVAFLFLCLPVAWWQSEVGILAVSVGIEGTDYTYVDNTYTILTEKALTFSGTTTDHIVVKEGVTANVTISNVSINVSTTLEIAAILLEKNARLTLTLNGANTLKSGKSMAGIQLMENSYLIVTAEDETHSLDVTGGNNTADYGSAGAGIGGKQSDSYKATVEIMNGKINSTGGTGGDLGKAGHGVGIGDNLVVLVKGGNITATGGNEPWRGTAGVGIKGKVTVQGGTFTNCSFSGESFVMYKGTITNTDGSNITAKNVTVNGGEITITMPDKNVNNAIGNNDCTVTINGGTVNVTAKYKDETGDPSGAGIAGTIVINGGHVIAKSKGCNGAGIGGYGSTGEGIKVNCPITIRGGIVEAEGVSHVWNEYTTIGIGTINSTTKAGTITIEGGLVKTNGIGSNKANTSTELIIQGGSIVGEMKNITPGDGQGNDLCLGITPEIENVTDVSVDDKPYYVPGNHDGDNKLYLYMTADMHTITVRTKGGTITTYEAEYKTGGNTTDGYFTITEKGSPNTPTEQSVISFEDEVYTTQYTPEEYEWKVKLNITVKQTKARLRNAAMNSVQLVLTDDEQGLTYYSDKQEVGASDEYTFTFSTKGLEVGTYKLTAQYGGNKETLISAEVTETLTITQADGTTATDYTEPEGLNATYEDLLSDIPLGQGWAWDSPETSVGKVGVHGYQATFTPSDKNYGTVSKNLSVRVNKKEVTEAPAGPASLKAITYNPSQTLAGVTLDNDWIWVDKTIVPDVKTGEYTAYYDTDYDNYDYSKVEGYNDNKIERGISLQVNPALLTVGNFSYDAESKTVAYKGTDQDALTITIYYSNVTTLSEYSEKMPQTPGTYQLSIEIESDNYETNGKLTSTDWRFIIEEPKYKVFIDDCSNGSVEATPTEAKENEIVTLTVKPNTGYELESLLYTYGDQEISIDLSNTSFTMPASDVTVTATFKLKPVIDPDPDPWEPEPDPVYYTVTLPAVEGATTDPSAGEYTVEAWNSFVFYLTLDADYDQSKPVVTTSRGETIEPRASDRKYVIPYVRSDLDIRISGIVKNPDPVANEAIRAETIEVRGGEGCLFLRLGMRREVGVYTFTGSLLRFAEVAPGDSRWALPTGNYIVRIDGKSYKVAVR